MATLRSDIIIPEVFTPYVIEQTTQRDAFWLPVWCSLWRS
jgi:hypothetical protein